MFRWPAVLILVVVLAATACSGGDSEQRQAMRPAGGATEVEASEGFADTAALGDTTDDMAYDQSDVRSGEAASSAAGVGSGRLAAGDQRAAAPAVPPAGEGGVTDSLPDTMPPPRGDRVIKEGTIRVEIAEDGFDEAFGRVIDAAARVGGSVLASNTSTHDDGGTSGSVTVRVPVQAFEELLVGMGGIGEIRSRQITAQDVSTEFIDLESRLRHLQAQERFYLELLDRAQVVGDAIAVQQHLDSIQSQIEQVKGRLAYLDERTSYSTLTIELFETGAIVPLLETEEPARPSLAAAWAQARDAFVQVVGALLVVAFFLAPLAPLALVAYLLWRSRRSPQAPPTAAAS